MYCITCGTENEDSAQRCLECGSALIPASAAVAGAGTAARAPEPNAPPPITSSGRPDQTRSSRFDSLWAMVAAPRNRGETTGGGNPESRPVQNSWPSPPAAASFSPPAASETGNPTRIVNSAEILRTQYHPSFAAPAPEPGRKIVGVLITYTWNPEGQIFPVYEGRNIIGRDPDKCDVAIPQDASMSEINTHITYRTQFVLGDMVSLNGTFLEQVPVEAQFVPLPNAARIRCGATDWIFLAIPGAESTPHGAPPGITQ